MTNDVTTDGVQTDTQTEETQTEETQTEETQTEETQTEETQTEDVDNQSTDETTYADFDMKEGQQLDTDALTLATPLFNELGLDQGQAQKAVDMYSDLIQAGAKKQVDAFNDQIATWRNESENDSEFGGDNFEENVKLAQTAVNKFGTPELKQVLEDYGVGNHPEIIRFMVKVGKLTAEDVPGSNGAATGTASDHVSILYPNAKKS